jgi:glycosyltransferase involved in cell wall biosynthesis
MSTRTSENRSGPLVSVIIRSHNYGRYLPEAIDSALSQTYPSLEVIVVDDGSTDDSVAAAARYGDRIHLLTQANEGVERASNRAVTESHGELISFLDADDAFEPTYVATLVSALKRADADFAYSRARYVGAHSGLTRTFPFSPYHIARRLNYVNGCALTKKRDFVAVGGLSEDLDDVALEDWDLCLKLIEAGKRGTYVREPLLRWRRHETGSRNPEDDERLTHSVAAIRARHAPLVRVLSDSRGNIAYATDLAIAVLEFVLGFSRFPGLTRTAERLSWRRFTRWHLPMLQ